MIEFLIAATIFWGSAATVPADQVHVEWTNPAGMVVLSGDPTLCGYQPEDTKTIVLERGCWDQISRSTKCTLIAHEYGHMIGRDHSADEDSIMAPEFYDTTFCINATAKVSRRKVCHQRTVSARKRCRQRR